MFSDHQSLILPLRSANLAFERSSTVVLYPANGQTLAAGLRSFAHR